MELLIGIGIFILTVLLIEGLYFLFSTIKSREKTTVRKRLKALSSSKIENESTDILRKKRLSEIPWFNRLLMRFRWTERSNRLLRQAGIERPIGFFILLSFVLAAGGFLVASGITSSRPISILLAAVLGMIPFFYISSKKKRRMQEFQRQFPEALDLVARALKAGHAFTGGLKLVADEMTDPIATEFGMALDEVNFGVGIPEALKNLSDRVDCPDVKFFVISIVIQRETGGNLAEILEKIASLIRERFKLYGRIRILSAQARLSAIILIVLPFVVAFGLLLMNRTHFQPMITDPIGRIIIVTELILMIFGIFVMRRMIQIKV